MRQRAIQQIYPDVSLNLRISQYLKLEAAPEMQAAARALEQRFSVEFETLTHFPSEALKDLHHAADDPSHSLDRVQIASSQDESILTDLCVLTEVANSTTVLASDRRRFYDALLSIYSKLPSKPAEFLEDPKAVFVGIEREGRILAEAMHCLPEGRSIRPNAKRIWFDDGLLVGFDGIGPHAEYNQCVVIDGAIASGSTIIALLEHLRGVCASFRIYSAHAALEGVAAICRYADATGLDVRITVGHATKGLNDHYYAVLGQNPSKVVVGDLGDTISEIEY